MIRRQQTPIFHRFRSQQYDQPLSQSPNLYTKDIQKEKRIKELTSRGTLARSKYKIGQQTKISSKNDNDDEKITLLMKENQNLRKQIVQLKVQQFYQFDDKKLKDLLIENETLKKQLKKYKQLLQQTQIQNDFLRRTNIQLQKQQQKFQSSQFCDKKNKDNTLRTLAFTSRNTLQDLQLTQRIIQKPVISSSSNNDYDDFEDCRKLLQSKSTNKKDRVKKIRQPQSQYLLQLESKNKIMQSYSPRSSAKPTIALSSKTSNETLHYKKRRNQNEVKNQI